MKFELYTQLPKPKSRGNGDVSLNDDGVAIFFCDYQPNHRLYRSRLDSISSDGMLLSGMEENGFDAKGTAKYKYQEWWLQ